MNTILAITYSFFLSYMPQHSIGFNSNSETFKNSSHVEFMLGADIFNLIHIYSGEETFQIPNSIFNYYPYRQSYMIGMEAHKEFNDSFKIKGGIRHKCTHPLDCWNHKLSLSDEAYTELYIDISGKFNVF